MNQNQNQNQQNPQLAQNLQAANTKFGTENASELAQSVGEISRILATQSLEIGSLIKGQSANAKIKPNPNQNMQNQQTANLYPSELEQSQGQVSQSLSNQVK